MTCRPRASIIADVRDPTLLSRIRKLIAAPPASSGGPTVDQIEYVLTEAYAEQLALEAERWRLERSLGEVAARLAEGEQVSSDELAVISTRMSAAGEELIRLRSVLAALRERASEARAAA
jgi:hypothetical protein